MNAARLEPGLEILNRAVARAVDEFHAEYRNASPFPHIVIDDFLEASVADALLAEFPSFDRGTAVVEYGAPSKKVAVPDVDGIGPAYRQFNVALKSRPFLDWLGGVTGINDLQIDPDHYGGGTHENLEGTELDPHVDFNIHPSSGLHRRLNLIVYLNPGWQPQWGGGIEVHLDPRSSGDYSKVYTPIFNRCIIFETSERSWHGFRRIVFPPEHRQQSRKSISIYLYTKSRPEATIAPAHSTVFVQRPLADFVTVGDVVTPRVMEDLRIAVGRRDESIRDYQRRELEQSANFDSLKVAIAQYASAVLVPLVGSASQRLGTVGVFPDGWVSPHASIALRAEGECRTVAVVGWVPEFAGTPNQVRVSTPEGEAIYELQPGQTFQAEVPVRASSGEYFELKIETAVGAKPSELIDSLDERELAFLIDRVTVV